MSTYNSVSALDFLYFILQVGGGGGGDAECGIDLVVNSGVGPLSTAGSQVDVLWVFSWMVPPASQPSEALHRF